MLSRSWTSVLPIYVWVIDHPAGTILVDTGPKPTAQWRYPMYHFYYPLAYRTRVGATEGIVTGIDEIGMTVDDIDMIFLTHIHPDHAEGTDLIPNVPIYIDENAFNYAGSLRGRFWGEHPSLRPDPERAEPVSLTGDPVGTFDRSYELADGVSIIPTPGHTAHHRSIAVEGDGPSVCIAADACMQLTQLDTGSVDGVSTRLAAGRDTLDRIARWRREEEVIVLPSHDTRGYNKLMQARS